MSKYYKAEDIVKFLVNMTVEEFEWDSGLEGLEELSSVEFSDDSISRQEAIDRLEVQKGNAFWDNRDRDRGIDESIDTIKSIPIDNAFTQKVSRDEISQFKNAAYAEREEE